MTDYLPSAIVTFMFVVLIPWGVDVWILSDTIITTVFGLTMIFSPKHFLSRQTKGELDDVHLHMYRMCGIMLLSSTMFAWLARKSKDQNIKSAILWGRVVGVSLYVMARVHGYFQVSKSIKWNKQALLFGIYGDCLWLLGNFVYSLKVTDLGKVTTTLSKADFYLKSDFVQCFLFGISFFVMPRLMLGFQTTKTLNHLHCTLIRMMAAFVFNTGIIAWKSLQFSENIDKIWHFVSRVMGTSGLITAQIYAQFTTSSWTLWHIYFGMFGMSLWSANASFGYFNLKNILDKHTNNGYQKQTSKQE
ncbi:uncharacterized protein LOC134705324 [Mytilus trossulus]|uniref:uncharacterized protein LOC134705324 n=1 Tax=Mytilus trossulus TaxID=6551 RepID=UPI003007E1A1